MFITVHISISSCNCSSVAQIMQGGTQAKLQSSLTINLRILTSSKQFCTKRMTRKPN